MKTTQGEETELPTPVVSAQSGLLAGYSEEQLTAISRAWAGVCEDCLCDNTLEQMEELQKLGLVEMRDAPEQWPEAEYGYVMTDKGEAIVKEYRQWLRAS